MRALTSPKVTPGTHCQKLRTKGMYINAVVDPDEASFYDPYEATFYWCAKTQTGFGPDGQPVRPESCSGGRCCCKV